MAVLTPTDRPESFRNRWVMEVLVAFFFFFFFFFWSRSFFDFTVGVWAFVIGLSQMSSSFFSMQKR